MSLQLRPLQVNSIEMLRDAFRAGHRSVMLYGPTGFGKTEMAIALMQATAEKGNHSAMLLDRILLCDQTSLRLAKYSIEHGVLQSGHWRYRPEEKIQVCSAQTLEARGSFPRCELLIVDEAHAQRSETIEFIKAHPKIRVVGLSASPFTRGLGATYEHVVSATTTKQLVDEGWLAPLRVFIAKEVDMTDAKKSGGEWTNKSATERGIKITGDIVAEWIQKTHEVFGEPRKTIVFSSGVEHGADLANRFAAAGYNFVSISYRDDDQFKKDVIEDFSRPDTSIHGVIATDILTKGFDVSDVMIGISARPFSKSFSSHVQQMGRVMRPHPGKEFALWLDHSGNYLRFRDDWDELYANGVDKLDDGAEKTKPEQTAEQKEASKCPKCHSLWPRFADVCPSCGFAHPRRSEIVDVPGKLEELSGQAAEKYSGAVKEQWYQELLGYARNRGFSDGYAYHKYMEKFGVKPKWANIAKDPGIEVLNYIKSRAIAYSKRRVQ